MRFLLVGGSQKLNCSAATPACAARAELERPLRLLHRPRRRRYDAPFAGRAGLLGRHPGESARQVSGKSLVPAMPHKRRQRFSSPAASHSTVGSRERRIRALPSTLPDGRGTTLPGRRGLHQDRCRVCPGLGGLVSALAPRATLVSVRTGRRDPPSLGRPKKHGPGT